MRRFGDKLRELRLRRGMTQRELAQALGYVTSGYISEVETLKKMPSLDLVLKTARLFGVSSDVLTRDDLELPVPEPE
ncbi:MAG TPA: helix-turn-helix transcriptional regulator [Roseiflexaceae bacterium]|nr:helix-turn-helix transcriptional regulator [Roseiflexaceae bacterium]